MNFEAAKELYNFKATWLQRNKLGYLSPASIPADSLSDAIFPGSNTMDVVKLDSFL